MNLKKYIDDNYGYAYVRAIKEFEFQLYSDALEMMNYDITATAHVLGVSRITVKKAIHRLNICIKEV